MPYRDTIRIPNEPILIITYEGDLKAEDVVASTAEINRFQLDEPAYIIVDLSDITSSSFSETMQILQHQSQGQAGTTTAPDLAAIIFVGTDDWTSVFADTMRNRMGDEQRVALFRSLDDAIAAIRVMIENDRNV